VDPETPPTSAKEPAGFKDQAEWNFKRAEDKFETLSSDDYAIPLNLYPSFYTDIKPERMPEEYDPALEQLIQTWPELRVTEHRPRIVKAFITNWFLALFPFLKPTRNTTQSRPFSLVLRAFLMLLKVLPQKNFA
jgi:hypothetical protein